jgi:hypothetical protein
MAAELHFCSICQDNIGANETRIQFPTCNHEFHLCCIGRWFVDNNTCPNCMREINDVYIEDVLIRYSDALVNHECEE